MRVLWVWVSVLMIWSAALIWGDPQIGMGMDRDESDRSLFGFEYGSPERLGHLDNKRIHESSGIAISRLRENVFWTHNDSGDRAILYSFDSAGRDLHTYSLPNVHAFDWEDMASFVRRGKSYLLVADTGDNGESRRRYRLHLMEEPKAKDRQLRLQQTILFTYEDGPHNCEAIGYDPIGDQIVLTTKISGLLTTNNSSKDPCKVYVLPFPKPGDSRQMVANSIATLKLPYVTAMDISPDGRRVIVMTYGPAFEYARRDGENLEKAFSRPGRPVLLPIRKQGEAICYAADGKTLYLTSESRPCPLYRVPVKP